MVQAPDRLRESEEGFCRITQRLRSNAKKYVNLGKVGASVSSFCTNHSHTIPCNWAIGMHKTINDIEFLAKATLLMAIGFGFLILFWLFYPYQPVVLNHPPTIMNENKQVKAGELVEIHLDFDKKMNVTPTTTWYLINGYVLELAETSVVRPLGVNQTSAFKLIPISTFVGTHRVQIQLEYKVNPIRTIEYTWVTDEFEVIL